MRICSNIIVFLLSLWLLSTHRWAEATPPLTLPSPNPKVQEYVRAQFRFFEPALGANVASAYERFGSLGSLLDIQKSEGLNDTQLAEQLFLSCFDFKDERAGFVVMGLAHFTTLVAHQPDQSAWLEAVAPYLEGTDEQGARVRFVAEGMLEQVGALSPGFLGRESERNSLSLVEGYLAKHRPEDHPNLIRICLQREPTTAFTTLFNATVDRFDHRELRRQQKELQLLIMSFELADNSAEADRNVKTAAAEEQVLARLKSLSESPFWCMRAYVASMFWNAPFKKDQALLEKLAKDEHPVVARVAQGVLDNK